MEQSLVSGQRSARERTPREPRTPREKKVREPREPREPRPDDIPEGPFSLETMQTSSQLFLSAEIITELLSSSRDAVSVISEVGRGAVFRHVHPVCVEPKPVLCSGGAHLVKLLTAPLTTCLLILMGTYRLIYKSQQGCKQRSWMDLVSASSGLISLGLTVSPVLKPQHTSLYITRQPSGKLCQLFILFSQVCRPISPCPYRTREHHLPCFCFLKSLLATLG